MTPNGAKKIIKKFLDEEKIPYTKLRAKTQHISALRVTHIFVRVFGWVPGPRYRDVERVGEANDFIVLFERGEG